MSSGKALFRQALAREPLARPALLLHATRACAAYANLDPTAFVGNSELVRSILSELRQVCGADALTCLYDPVAEDLAFAEIMLAGSDEPDFEGIEGFDLAAHRALVPYFDILNRLLRTVGQSAVAVCGVASGPISLAWRSLGRDRLEALAAKDMAEDLFDAYSAPLITMLRRMCELGVDAVVLREDVALDALPGEMVENSAFAYRMLNAVTRHYNVPLVLALDPGSKFPQAIHSLEIDVLSLPAGSELPGGLPAIQSRIPDDWLLSTDELAAEHEQILANLRPSGQVVEAGWSGEGRVAIERLMRIGRVCGALSP